VRATGHHISCVISALFTENIQRIHRLRRQVVEGGEMLPEFSSASSIDGKSQKWTEEK